MLKKFSSDKVNVTKNALFFLSLLISAEAKVHLSKSVCGIFLFDSVSLLLKFIFCSTKKHGLFDFKTS